MGCGPSKAPVQPVAAPTATPVEVVAQARVSSMRPTPVRPTLEESFQPQCDAATAGRRYAKRPVRSGMWFLVHEDLLGSIKREETVDIFSEFFSLHPNGIQLAAQFVAVRLSIAQVNEQEKLVRMSSYRWADVKGVGERDGEYAIPKNYAWVLECAKANGYVVWVDFVANVGVNVRVAETIGYMGQLYAEQTVVANWMYSLSSLEEAIPRGWIYQESAFGKLDIECVDYLLAEVRQIGLAYLTRGDEPSCVELIKACRLLAKLLERRGLSRLAFPKDSPFRLKNLKYYMHYANQNDKQHAAGLPKLLWERRLKPEPSAEAAEAAVVFKCDKIYGGRLEVGLLCVDLFTMSPSDYATLLAEFKYRLCTPIVPDLADSKAFLSKFGISLLRAYLSSQLTFEVDRMNAVTAVASFILSSRGASMSGAEVMEYVWETNSHKWAKGGNYFASEVNADLLRNPCGISKLELGGMFLTPLENSANVFKYSYTNVQGDIVEKLEKGKLEPVTFAVCNNMSMRVTGFKRAEDLVGQIPHDVGSSGSDSAMRSAGFNGDGTEVEFLFCTPPPGSLPLGVVFVANRSGRVYALCLRKLPDDSADDSCRPNRDLCFC